jgi:2-oxoglutarate dehydrogenase E2 component (dihydrolipoamide succinyltransferase)
MCRADVAGSGRGGRVTKEDAVAAQPKPARWLLPLRPRQGCPADRRRRRCPWRPPEQRVPMSRLRARIAERLLQSQATNAILTTFNEVNMAPVMALRKQYGDKFEKAHGVRLGFMGFFVKAAVCRAAEVPDPQRLGRWQRHRLSRLHRHRHRRRFAARPGRADPAQCRSDEHRRDREEDRRVRRQKAKDGKLSIEDLTGGTFSISNGGVFGSMMSTPIINPPQSAILGIHATKDRAVVENGQVVVRPINYLAMSYDHRIIDGREAVLGLVTMKEALEDPARLLLGV